MELFNFIKNKVKAIIGAFSGDPRYVQHFEWDPSQGGGGGDVTKVYVDQQDAALQSQIDTLGTNKADKATTYTKTEVDNLLDDKQDKITDSTITSVSDTDYISDVDATNKTNKRITLANFWNWIKEKALALNGGTMTGSIINATGDIILNNADNDSTSIYGGNSYNSGARIQLRGKNRSTNAGYFQLCATDGTNTAELIGNPNGELTWNGKRLDIADKTGTIEFTLNTEFSIDNQLVIQLTEKVFYVRFQINVADSLSANVETPFATGFTINGSNVYDTTMAACLRKDSSAVGCTWNQNRFFITPTVALPSTTGDKRVKVSGICIINS